MADPLGSINDWDEDSVCLFFANLGYPQFKDTIRENEITGDLLMVMDADSLKELGLSVGQRLNVLKSVYLVKLAHDIPIGDDDYIPPSEAAEKQDDMSLDKMHERLKNHAERLLKVEEENRTLRSTLNSALEDLNRRIAQGEESPLGRSKTFKWPDFIKPQQSPTKTEATLNSPQPSPRRSEMDIRSHRNTGMTDTTRMSTTSTAVDHAPAPASARPSRQESSDNLKSFKVSLEDPAWKVLPAALKKYKINNDDWQNYAMFICFGSAGNRVERCLSYDEKPLLLFQKLKDAKKNPVFMLKHIKDIRSPIVVAQQKHAARKASASGESLLNAAHGGTPNTGNGRPPRLRVDHSGLNSATPLMTGNSLQTSWPELMSPAVDSKPDGLLAADSSLRSTSEGDVSTGAPPSHGNAARELLPMQGVSYAVAIYPYMAEQEDEFDVVVGNTFVILSRARGWWVVQRDEVGTGEIDADPSKQGWVPAGCLLETKVPVASAIAEASARSGAATAVALDQRKQPILPLSIVSTSFPGVALMDYQGKDGDELDLVKDEPLRVFKRYNHWSYAVKEESGDRGWVPSWYIGKVAQAAPDPKLPPVSPTMATSSALNGTMELEGMSTAQPSPMSSAFPGRSAVVT